MWVCLKPPWFTFLQYHCLNGIFLILFLHLCLLYLVTLFLLNPSSKFLFGKWNTYLDSCLLIGRDINDTLGKQTNPFVSKPNFSFERQVIHCLFSLSLLTLFHFLVIIHAKLQFWAKIIHKS